MAEVTDDIDGQPRFAPYDLGADEYQSSTPVRRVRRPGAQPLALDSGTSAGVSASPVGRRALASAAPAVPVAVVRSGGPQEATPGAVPTQAAPASTLRVRAPAPLLLHWSKFRSWMSGLWAHVLS